MISQFCLFFFGDFWHFIGPVSSYNSSFITILPYHICYVFCHTESVFEYTSKIKLSVKSGHQADTTFLKICAVPIKMNPSWYDIPSLSKKSYIVIRFDPSAQIITGKTLTFPLCILKNLAITNSKLNFLIPIFCYICIIWYGNIVNMRVLCVLSLLSRTIISGRRWCITMALWNSEF